MKKGTTSVQSPGLAADSQDHVAFEVLVVQDLLHSRERGENRKLSTMAVIRERGPETESFFVRADNSGDRNNREPSSTHNRGAGERKESIPSLIFQKTLVGGPEGSLREVRKTAGRT